MDCGFIKALSSLFDVFFLCFFSSFCDHSNVNKLWAHQGKCILGVFIDLINEEQEFETMFDKSSLNMLKNLKPL